MRAYNIHYKQFCIDKNLAFLIQQTTGDSTREILAYFYSLGTFTAEEAINTSKAHRIDKKVILMYKNTVIPFKLEVGSNYNWRQSEKVQIYIEVSFPKEKDYFNGTDIMNSMVEMGLGLVSEETDPLPKFECPTFKTPIFLRELRKHNEQRFNTNED